MQQVAVDAFGQALGSSLAEASSPARSTPTTGDFARMDGAGYRSDSLDAGAAFTADVAARKAAIASYMSSGSEPYLVAAPPDPTRSVLPQQQPVAYRAAPRLDANGSPVFSANGMPVYDRVKAAAPIEPGVYNYESHIQQDIDSFVATWNNYPKGTRLIDGSGNLVLNPLTVKVLGPVGMVDSMFATVKDGMDQRLDGLVSNAEDAAVQDRRPLQYFAAQLFPRSTTGALVAALGGPAASMGLKTVGALALTRSAPLALRPSAASSLVDGEVLAASRIASPSNSKLRAIAAGVEELSPKQAAVLAQLEGNGSRVVIPKRGFGQNDLAALSAATGDEFAMFTAGGRRLVARGTSNDLPIGTFDGSAQQLAKGWRWSSHVHPDGVLRSSVGDRVVLSVFRNQRSAILDPFGGRSLFGPTGDMLSPNWLP